MKTKSIMIIAAIMIVTSAVFAQGNKDTHKSRGEGPLMNIPDLTDDQKEKIKEIRTEHMKEMLPVKNELKEKEAKLRTVSTGENVSLENIYAVIDEIGELKIKMAKKRAAFKFEVRNQLTDDQKVYFDTHGPKRHHSKKMMHKTHHMQK